MDATGIRWWIVIPLVSDGRRLGLLHFGRGPAAASPPRSCWTTFARWRARRARAGHHAADLRPAPHPPALRAHPRGARRGRHRAGHQRADGLRQRGRGAAARLRDLGRAARHATPELTERFDIFDADGGRVGLSRTCRRSAARGPRRAAAAARARCTERAERVVAADEGDAARRRRRAARGQHHRGRHQLPLTAAVHQVNISARISRATRAVRKPNSGGTEAQSQSGGSAMAEQERALLDEVVAGADAMADAGRDEEVFRAAVDAFRALGRRVDGQAAGAPSARRPLRGRLSLAAQQGSGAAVSRARRTAAAARGVSRRIRASSPSSSPSSRPTRRRSG